MVADVDQAMLVAVPPEPYVARSFPATAATGGVQIESRAVLLLGWALYETTGAAAAVVELFDGPDGNGNSLAVVQLAQGTAQAVALAEPGLLCLAGLFVKVVSGSARGSAWVRLT